MDYVKAHVTLRVPMDGELWRRATGRVVDGLGGRQVSVEVGGAELLGAVDDAWVDDGGPAGGVPVLVVELDVHTAVQVDGASALLALAFPDDPPPQGLTWTCMVCGRLREDAAIAVAHRRLAVDPDGFPESRVNVRHCNDDPSCISLAAVAPRWGAAPVARGTLELEPDESTASFAGACPFLTCTAMEPHAHPVCGTCDSLRYGNVSCPECREKRPAMEARETELGWFPAAATS